MKKLMEIACPCCEAKLKVDIVTEAVITYEAKKKAPPIEDFAKAVQNLKGEAARRDAAFEKSFAATKNQGEVPRSEVEPVSCAGGEVSAEGGGSGVQFWSEGRIRGWQGIC